MKKITIIAPFLFGQENLDQFSKKIAELARNKYDYKVICFVPEEPKQFDDEHFEFQKIDGSMNFDDCVTKGFESKIFDAVLVLDESQPNFEQIADEMLKKWENGADIVLAKNEKKIGLFKKLYSAILKIAKLDADFFANKNFGLFSKDVAKIIKSFPSKNYYLRNFDCWVDYKIAFVPDKMQSKAKTKLPVFNQYMVMFLCSMLVFLLSLTLVCALSTLVPAQNQSTFVLVGICLMVASICFGFYNLYLWLLRRKTRLDL